MAMSRRHARRRTPGSERGWLPVRTRVNSRWSILPAAPC